MKVILCILTVFICAATAYPAQHKLISDQKSSSKKSISATVTAYTPAPRENGGRGKKIGTAMGTRIRPGIVAVSRDLLHAGWRFGAKVHIKGLGIFTIEDTMHQRFRHAVDVAVPNLAEAQKIGRRIGIEVTLLERGREADG